MIHLLSQSYITWVQYHKLLIVKMTVVVLKAVLSSLKMWFGDGGKSLQIYYQNMYLV
jgi:hypothetical protein